MTTTNHYRENKALFLGCVIALVATSFGFIIRALVIDDWAADFNLTETQKGELLGVGLWPFAISIILFSFIIDRVGYKNAMVFGFACHILSAVITIFADDYWDLYIGTFIMALGNGTVEAYINPVVATLFRKEKTRWMNTLHSGWPSGFVLGGLLIIALGGFSWKVKVALILIPSVLYFLLLITKKFPVSERVRAGVSYKDMLKESGYLGAFIMFSLIMAEISRVFDVSLLYMILLVAACTAGYGLYVRSVGKPLFLFFMLLMIPLAVTELGTDSWITSLMEPELAGVGFSPLWVLVYTSLIMVLMRLSSAPLVRRFTPLGLLAISSVLAATGLLFLSVAEGFVVFVAATIYGLGKSFFWPTTLGVVSEQFPRGGALTLNGVAAVGMLGVGIVGTALLGNIQDRKIESGVSDYDSNYGTELNEYMEEKQGMFGDYFALNGEKLEVGGEEDQSIIEGIRNEAKKGALAAVAILPIGMFVSYILMLLYFRSKGGYKPLILEVEGGE